MNKPKVFISYSWDNEVHIARVTKLANSFRDHGIECVIDNFKDCLDDVETDWETWIDKNMESVDYILVVCTENYKNCFDENDQCLGDGGVKWEAQLLRSLLKREAVKIYTIIFNERDKINIPVRLRGKNHYYISEQTLNVYDEKSAYHNIYRQLTKQYKTVVSNVGEIILFPLEKEELITKLEEFLNDESIDLQVLKDISKKYLDPIYHNNITKNHTIKELITYLEGVVIDDSYSPLTCIINHIHQEKSSINIEIKSWLDDNYHDALCKSNMIVESQPNIDKSKEDRIILDFEKTENSNKVDLSIRYSQDGKFGSNEGKTFIDKDIDDIEFQKEVFDKLKYDLPFYEHIDIILPQQFLLTDIKQWSYYDKEICSQICFTNDCCVNIHMRERAFRSNIKNLWEPVLEQLNKPLSETMKDINSPEDKVNKETYEVGLKYRFLPDNTRNFSHRVMGKMIVLRCGNSKQLEDFNPWLEDNKDLKLSKLKEEVDKIDNAHMTIMWNDPNIPLKGNGIDAK